jgi:fibronectin-binding autotransporter adhesin
MQKRLNQHSAKDMMFNIIDLLCLLSMAAVAQAEDVAVNALPTGGQVVAGDAHIVADHANASAPVLNINQTSQRAIVNWDKFDVGSAATVNFNQPNAQATTLNKITSGSPSKIMGKINAPGNVILMNQQGVYFTPSATLDVGSVVATSHDISNADFMDGKHTYDRNGAAGKVINEGTIKTALGGYVALLAPEVRNAGVIVAQMGTVVLAAGERITLNFDPSRHLASITTTPSTINTLVENKLAVQAPGGLIILSARAVNNLTAGVIKQSGTLSASADGITNIGGRILLTANTVKLDEVSQTVARGNNGGGEVKVVATQTATVKATAKVSVSATETGHAGKIDIHADEKTTIDGTLLAQGGKQSGNGGIINTTSHGQVEIGNTALVKAGVRGTSGEVGVWNIVTGAFNVNANNANVVSNAINQNNVNIQVSAAACAALGNCNLLAAAGLSAGQLVITRDALIQKTSPRLTTLSLQANNSEQVQSQILVDGKILSAELSPLVIKVISEHLVEIRQNAAFKAAKIEVISENGLYNGDIWSYFSHGNGMPLPALSLFARTLAIAVQNHLK